MLGYSADHDEMPHYAAFHLGPHCLPKYPLGVSDLQRVNHLTKLARNSTCKRNDYILVTLNLLMNIAPPLPVSKFQPSNITK